MTQAISVGRKLVVGRIRELWNKSQKFGVSRRFLGALFREQPPAAIYVREFSGFDRSSTTLTGQVIGNWRYDDSGVNATDPPEIDAAFDKRFDRIEFCLSQKDVFMFYYYSRFGGWGDIARIVCEDGKKKLVVIEQWHF